MTADNSATSVLTVHGNYVGNNGQLHLQTVLGDEHSATDKLVVSEGSISGHTQLSVSNLGGAGGLTQNNGIEVVQALNGAVSSSDAFALKGLTSAGAYQYFLFRGGVIAGTENNWYLRSSVVAVQPPAVPSVPPPVVPPIAVAPIAPTQPVIDPTSHRWSRPPRNRWHPSRLPRHRPARSRRPPRRNRQPVTLCCRAPWRVPRRFHCIAWKFRSTP